MKKADSTPKQLSLSKIFFKIFRRSRKAVSPVLAVVLLISLTIAAGAVIWAITNDVFSDKNVNLILERHGVADTNQNGLGDLITLEVRNIGTDAANIDDIVLVRDGAEIGSWVLVNNSYTINTGQIDIIAFQTLTSTDEVNVNHEVIVRVRDTSAGVLEEKELAIPAALSAIPVLFDGQDFSQLNLNAQGWTTFTYATHGGGPGIVIEGTSIKLDTNDDILYYLLNNSFAVGNGIISSEFRWGDNDGFGVAFRIQDERNYYWFGYTEDHTGPNNRAGHNEPSFDGPWFVNDAQFELHKIVNGQDTLLDATPAPFSLPPGSNNNPTGPIGMIIAFSGDQLAVSVEDTSGQIYELFEVVDTEFTSGFWGVFSMAADNTRLDSFTVTA